MSKGKKKQKRGSTPKSKTALKREEAIKLSVKVEEATKRSLMLMCAAMNSGLGIGKIRFYRDFMPEFERLSNKYQEFLRLDGNSEYADIWLRKQVADLIGGDFHGIGE